MLKTAELNCTKSQLNFQVSQHIFCNQELQSQPTAEPQATV